MAYTRMTATEAITRIAHKLNYRVVHDSDCKSWKIEDRDLLKYCDCGLATAVRKIRTVLYKETK